MCSQYGSGSYYLVVEYGNCSVTSNTVDINCTVGTGETEYFNNVIVYPNPFNKILSIEGELDSETHLTITLYNMLGVEIAKNNLNAVNKRISIQFNMEDLPVGTYFVTLKTGKYNKIIMVEKVE